MRPLAPQIARQRPPETSWWIADTREAFMAARDQEQDRLRAITKPTAEGYAPDQHRATLGASQLRAS